ncbi:VOC family protein [Achromobacter seleniivolatilans]|uniref:VOC family protein n=1 Tax=Achromobacter seleniivolatilans TaxID=3047478 RepID=A0ABY9M5W3_9BURK|nr:VOC family protein [Achromobacter sp. R39]WMD22376.1 VOC family protein [Achromobacter sp. R39]
MSSILSIDSVQLPFLSRRLDAVREFYQRVIGLDEMDSADDQRLLYALGGATLSLSPVTEVSRAVKPDYLAIKTHAYDEILARLRLAGHHPVCSLPDAVPRVMYVKDPSGNQLAILG